MQQTFLIDYNYCLWVIYVLFCDMSIKINKEF